MKPGVALRRIVSLLSVALLATRAAAAESPPNLIVIMADDLGYADLGCYGSADHDTPHLDRLAAEGTRFTSFYVTSPVCTPTRAAFLTGRFPRRCRSPALIWPTSTHECLPSAEVTLAELLREAGYATHLSGKWHLGHGERAHLPMGHGFDSWYGIPYPNDMAPAHPVAVARREVWPEMPMMRDDTIVEQPIDVRLLTQQFTADAVAFITRNHHRPFFLFLAHAMPHAITGASADFRGRSRNGIYGDAVAEIDWSTGEIMRAVRACGLDSRTLVVFCNDNGAVTPEAFAGKNASWFWPDLTHGSNAPLRGGKQSTFEGGVRVPAIWRWPGVVRPAAVEDSPACITDVLPTMLDYLDRPLPPNHLLDGRTIRPLLEGTGPRDSHDILFGGHADVTAIRSGRWKLQRPVQPRWMVPPLESDRPLLFDLSVDPGETRNLAGEHPQVVADLLNRIMAYEAQSPVAEPLEYARRDTGPLFLDYYRPPATAGSTPPPLVISIHGGAWRHGSRKDVPLLPLLARGYAIASIDYRLTPTAAFPANLLDIRDAIRFLERRSRKLGFDPDRMAIAGSSAGGHLAALAGLSQGVKPLDPPTKDGATARRPIRGIVSLFGASNLQTILAQSTPHGLSVRVPALELLLGGSPQERPDLARLASPVAHLDPDDPPVLLIHGDADPQMPVEQSQELAEACRRQGVPVELVLIRGGLHGGPSFTDAERISVIHEFLERAFAESPTRP